ncbi:Pilus assembly protein PilO [Phytophthora palmivora]|uniref:Pilus assembly protein PilO n=1 Tax=Phytophthora palmivora TaxID=4796 RepID=A0A2P4XNC6_9STRA|nr:Pilus assembly protein PilO [Phytophthora palmivora]
METILAPLDLQLGNNMWKQPQSPLNPATHSPDAKSNLVRLPSLFAITASAATATTTSEWSPRLVGMNDVLSQVSPIKEKGSRLPSIGVMINRDASPESLSPVQKHCMDLYKQLQDTKTASPRQSELELNSLLADAAVRLNFELCGPPNLKTNLHGNAQRPLSGSASGVFLSSCLLQILRLVHHAFLL